jgi:hypothetical protein
MGVMSSANGPILGTLFNEWWFGIGRFPLKIQTNAKSCHRSFVIYRASGCLFIFLTIPDAKPMPCRKFNAERAQLFERATLLPAISLRIVGRLPANRRPLHPFGGK